VRTRPRDRAVPYEKRPAARIDWLGAPALKLHATLLVGVTLSATAGWFEWTRALSGHALAWAYSFEWPIFGLMGIYLWWRLLQQNANGVGAGARSRQRHRAQTASHVPIDDPELAAWEAYVARLHATDPPGGPPTRASA
jgi:hypothetical protein